MPFADFYSHGYLKPAIQGSVLISIYMTCPEWWLFHAVLQTSVTWRIFSCTHSLPLSLSLFLSLTHVHTQIRTRTHERVFSCTVYCSSLDDGDHDVWIYEHVHAEPGPVIHPHHHWQILQTRWWLMISYLSKVENSVGHRGGILHVWNVLQQILRPFSCEHHVSRTRQKDCLHCLPLNHIVMHVPCVIDATRCRRMVQILMVCFGNGLIHGHLVFNHRTCPGVY